MTPTLQADRCVTMPSGKRCLPTPYTYLFQAVIPTAGGILPNQVLSMDTDGDFWWYGTVAMGANYSLRFQDADKYYHSNDYLPVQFFQSSPTPAGLVFENGIFLPAGSPITIDLQDTSNIANNAAKVLVRGVKMLYM